jgi:hypothetical protein
MLRLFAAVAAFAFAAFGALVLAALFAGFFLSLGRRQQERQGGHHGQEYHFHRKFSVEEWLIRSNARKRARQMNQTGDLGGGRRGLARRVPGSSASLRRERSREIPGLSQKSQPVGRLTGGNGAQTTTHPQALRTGKGATGQESVGMSGVQESLQQQDSAAGAATAAKAGAWVTNIHATARATLRKPRSIFITYPTCSERSSPRHNPAGKAT